MALPFSPSISKNGFVFISGQIHLKDGILLEGTIEEQTHQVMKNIQTLLEKVGLSFQNVVKTTIYTTDMSLYAQVNEVYISYFTTDFTSQRDDWCKRVAFRSKIRDQHDCR
jgi:2-iminobutanoate/2-iminopropanoate deaminase